MLNVSDALITDKDDGHHMPASSNSNATADHTVGGYSASVKLSQLQQRVIDIHCRPPSLLVTHDRLQRTLTLAYILLPDRNAEHSLTEQWPIS